MSKNNSLDSQLEQASNKSSKRFIFVGVIGAAVLGLVIIITQLPMPDNDEVADNVEEQTSSIQALISEEDKQALQENLAALKKRLEDNRVKLAKMQWDDERSSTFSPTLDENYLAYAGGQYQMAQKGVDMLNSIMDDYDKEYQDAYESAHTKAQTAFDKEDINTATLLNNDSLTINPDYQQAKALKTRIEVYPTVIELLETLKQAESERNLDRQLNIIDQILLLDPERDQIKKKQQQVASLIKERDFSNAISDAFSALQKSDLNSAIRDAEKAKSIYPSRAELQAVLQKIEVLQQDSERTELLSTMKEAVINDDWNMVLAVSGEGLRSFPNESAFQSSNALARELVDASDILQIYIDKPKRLFDSNIRKVAQEDLDNFQHLTVKSASFTRMVQQIRTQLKTANTPVPVQFDSDGDTFIRVLRVGEVGETNGRLVNLLPGVYEIEGRCKGFKTKIMPLEVLPNQDNRILVVCDEKL